MEIAKIMKLSNTPKIYGLFDPRKPDDIKYVGKTIHNLNYLKNTKEKYLKVLKKGK